MAISDNPIVRDLRNQALRLDEWATKKYWLRLKTHYIFKDENFVISTEHPPTEIGTQRRIDMTVENYENGKFVLLLVTEAKTARATNSEVVTAETQLYDACYAHYLENPERERIWAMSVCGPYARIWAFHAQHGFLTPLFPIDGDLGDKSSYADFKTSERKFMAAFAFIKQNMVPPDSVFDDSDASMSHPDILYDDSEMTVDPQLSEGTFEGNYAAESTAEPVTGDCDTAAGDNTEPYPKVQDPTAMESHDEQSSYIEVELYLSYGKKETFIAFNHEGRPFRTRPNKWVTTTDEANKTCYDWHSNELEQDFRAYQWPS